MLVTHVIGQCPGCGSENTFGNASVGRHGILRGCRACKYKTTVPLPTTRKKVLYLDQFFFSKAFKEKDARFTSAAQKIADLASMQLISLPFSSIHEDETHLWRGYDGKDKDDLMEFIKSTARGHKFIPAYEVEEYQIVKAFENLQAQRPSQFDLEAKEALRPDIHGWDDYIWIDVGRYVGDIDQTRAYKMRISMHCWRRFPNGETPPTVSRRTFKLKFMLMQTDISKRTEII